MAGDAVYFNLGAKARLVYFAITFAHILRVSHDFDEISRFGDMEYYVVIANAGAITFVRIDGVHNIEVNVFGCRFQFSIHYIYFAWSAGIRDIMVNFSRIVLRNNRCHYIKYR